MNVLVMNVLGKHHWHDLLLWLVHMWYRGEGVKITIFGMHGKQVHGN